MATAKAAYYLENAIGRDSASVHTDISNYQDDDWGDENAPPIKATTWQGKAAVKVGKSSPSTCMEPLHLGYPLTIRVSVW